MQIDPKTPTRVSNMFDVPVNVPEPYKATRGYYLSAGEADALNTALRKNVYNVAKKDFEKAIAAGEKNAKTFQKIFDAHMADYKFGVGRKSDPVAREMRTYGENIVRNAFRLAGDPFTEEMVKAAYEKNLPQYESIWRAAAEEIIAKRKGGDIPLDLVLS